MHYWVMKSEPSAFSIDDLMHKKVSGWDGVRNYQARNLLREQMKKGDIAFFYHSSADVIGIVGLMEIVKSAYPDSTQFDPKEDHYDPKSTKVAPKWYQVDVKFKEKFIRPVTLLELKEDPFFDDMVLTQKGMRLSIQPVKEKHFKKIIQLAAQA
jgi:predicted RNA-binding protein with PUA-like domain